MSSPISLAVNHGNTNGYCALRIANVVALARSKVSTQCGTTRTQRRESSGESRNIQIPRNANPMPESVTHV